MDTPEKRVLEEEQKRRQKTKKTSSKTERQTKKKHQAKKKRTTRKKLKYSSESDDSDDAFVSFVWKATAIVNQGKSEYAVRNATDELTRPALLRRKYSLCL